MKEQEEVRLQVEGRFLDILANHGGERIVAGPFMESLVQELADAHFELKEKEDE